MPVRLPQGSLYRCPTCTARSSRPFHASTAQLALGPESPRFIAVPQPPQQTVPDKTRLKGVLPVPRDIFAGQDPRSPISLEKSTKEPANQGASLNPRNAWKERMAASRRKNLDEGLHALQDRRITMDDRQAARATRNQQNREARLHRPEPDDERLTAPSVDQSLLDLLKKGGLSDPHREARLAEMRQRHATKQAAREEDRRDSLHTLYVNARNFIITDAQLSSAIDDAFGTVESPKTFGQNGASVWDDGHPDTIEDMLNTASGKPSARNGSFLNKSSSGRSDTLTNQRVRRMAAELTGGRMPPTNSSSTG